VSGARGEVFELLVHGLEFCIAKRTSQAVLLGHVNKNILKHNSRRNI
jgi:hypothetical protein